MKNSGKQAMLLRLMQIIEEQYRYLEENNSFTREEKAEQWIVLMKTAKYLCNFDELEPIINEYFVRKAEKDKWER